MQALDIPGHLSLGGSADGEYASGPAPEAGISLDAPAQAAPTTSTSPASGSDASSGETLLPAEAPASPEAPTSSAVSTPLPVIEGVRNGHSNGHTNGNGKHNGSAASAISLSLGGPAAFKIQEDAPSCAECGSIMVRNGSCYKCLNCGSTSGCS